MKVVICIFCILLLSSVVLVKSDGWFIETDYSGSTCSNPQMLYIISVLSDRNQTTDCFQTSSGSIQGECDFTVAPIKYYATRFSDSQCSHAQTDAAVGAGYCLSGFSTSAAITCKKAAQKKVPQNQVDGLKKVAGYAYFSGSKCGEATFYHAELAPITSCPTTDPTGRIPNKCYASRNGGQEWVCGPVATVLNGLGFTIGN
eukprot:Phypoly_transcript_17816.p1 GENE.Phypoly_transcript_17816~~Phypoly_transcript_17816.p1  ORF type:complete len:219 (-),score=8.41 Phypoly_transcript_17816:136-738(-)